MTPDASPCCWGRYTMPGRIGRSPRWPPGPPARRPGDSGGVAVLLGALHDAGEDQAVATLAARAACQAPLDNYLGVARLLGALHHAGEDQAVATLTARAADAGLWKRVLRPTPVKLGSTRSVENPTAPPQHRGAGGI